MNKLPEKKIQKRTEEEFIDFKKILNSLLSNWAWFLLSIIACLTIAFLYTRYTPPIYQISAKLLVNDEDKGAGLGGGADALMDLGGLLGSKNSVDNEVEIIKTRFLMEQLVRQMQLNIIYGRKANFISRELNNAPFKLTLVKSADTISSTKINIETLGGNKLKITTKEEEKEISWNQTFSIKDVGSLRLTQNPGTKVEGTYFAIVTSIDDRVSSLMEQLTVGISNRQVSIMDIGLTYPLPDKGEEILRNLIAKYIQTNLGDKNAIADSTYVFIRERINVIASELGDVENKVESFKATNRLADMTEQSKLLVQNTGEFTGELAKAETQVSVLNDLESYLKDETKNKRVFPTSLLPQDMVFSGLVEQYNALLIERDKQLLSVTESSPFIENIDSQISGLRKGILANIQSTRNTFVLTRNKLRSQLQSAESKIEGVPEIEKNYLKLARNQKIKQELYIFLMQKAEETAISKASNMSVAKTIDPPKANNVPINPKKGQIMGIALFISLVLPFAWFFIVELLNNRVTTKEDITERTDVPVIGEITHNSSPDNMVVASDGRSAIAEQFRALRTNLSFYLKRSDQNVILFTSSVSGEGKSFTAINLGNILALTGKRVLLMEMDLRKPGLSAKLGVPNNKGFSNYAIDESLQVADLIKPLNISSNLFLVSSGPIPPNPAEVLMSERTSALINELKGQFDYIIMDAPPIGVVTDAQLLAAHADVAIYMVRQGVTLKDHIKIVEDLNQTDKMLNLTIIVNDIKSKSYGYGYGYGSYAEVQDVNFFQTLKNKFKKN